MNSGREIISLVAQRQDLDQFRRKNWEGTFEEYLDIVRSDPRVTQNNFERVYDMILSYGIETYEELRKNASATCPSPTRTTRAETPFSGSTARCGCWSTPSRAQPRATASKSACCCCTARSAAARARSPGS